MSSDSEMSSIYQSSSDPEEGDFVDSEDDDIGGGLRSNNALSR